MTRTRDLRSYIAALEELGDLDIIDREVDPHLEVGAVIRRSYETTAPAPLFTGLKGCAPGHRILGAPGALSSAPGKPLARIALSLGLPPEAGAREIVDALVQARNRTPVPPVAVDPSTAPCKQNILRGEAASLDGFPTPLLHDGDGGPYVNTWGTIIARTPDGSFTNWSIARIMMIDGKHMTGIVAIGQHIGNVWKQWADRGEPMPYALVQGAGPAVPFVSGMPLPDGVEETGYLGALLGEGIELVPCETNDLLVPADAEIVIEGHLSVERSAVEGPMGEFAGYRPSTTSMQPVYTIEAITHRDDPIWPAVVEGEPIDEYHTATGLTLAAEVLTALRAADLPVTFAWAPFETAVHTIVVTVRSDWRDHLPGMTTLQLAQRITDVIDAQRLQVMLPRIFVLDDDVDAADPRELAWALATRVHPTARRIVRTGPILPLLTVYTPQERESATGPKVTYDALLPAPGDGRDTRSSFGHIYPPHIRERVLAHEENRSL
ncbi:UbiD family decarboxylase [Streptomyces sp. SID685]|uniref:UbiD family decarboxylase n=1 Tax=Streptomyces sp. SID685 TaxID=2690322 RepID=UPI00136A1455|nr:UbiD family decarboxylase [Streptomyces sp. SID685]MYR85408.1 UbiD family decarboxylase [Streptomyces sp. SID685]